MLPEALFVDWEKTSEGLFAENARIVEPLISIQMTDGLHFGVAQFEIEDSEIFFQTLFAIRFGNDCCSALNAPTQNDLCRRTVVRFAI